eukprot:CAMPEP_0115695436 /NCGR_PEP_ID=MMETSP0272-20121206/64764_1 /TAXON_ID=71861 /ORGANISM="Scrippsiella trochoidea, Strain CCMP3099" /LENGTH=65 /DNA_ID=CAMNT_0003135633 /DNA_START=9 /DNA_END=203 /DNA_ORIENTATION=+
MSRTGALAEGRGCSHGTSRGMAGADTASGMAGANTALAEAAATEVHLCVPPAPNHMPPLRGADEA